MDPDEQLPQSKGKIDQGKKMMREGQKELRKMIDTKKAFKFTSVFSIRWKLTS